MTESKHLFASKTFWFNVALLVIFAANRGTETIDPAVAEPAAIVISSIINAVLLRKATKRPVHILPKGGDA